jgi:hypothetical protein
MTKYPKPKTLEEHIESQRQIHHLDWVTFYLVKFCDLVTGKTLFYKYGVTQEQKAILRFINPRWPDREYEYRHWQVKVICEVKMPPINALKLEWKCQERFPKNLRLPPEQKFKGIREIFRCTVKGFVNENKTWFKELKKKYSAFN